MIRNEVDHMIACLRERDDKLCSDAAVVIERLRAERLKLDQRIHNQRVALRVNWEIAEMRASGKRAWYPSKLLKAILNRGVEWHRGHGQSAREEK